MFPLGHREQDLLLSGQNLLYSLLSNPRKIHYDPLLWKEVDSSCWEDPFALRIGGFQAHVSE